PKVLASIRSIPTTTADRAFAIELARKKPSDVVPRLDLVRLASRFAALRDSLHISTLRHARDVLALYEEREKLALPSELDDRAREMFEPLFAIAAVADAASANEGRYTKALVEAAKAIAIARAANDADDDKMTAVIRALLDQLGEREVMVLPTDVVIECLGKTDALGWVEHAGHVRSLFRNLPFRSGTHRVHGDVERGYR